MASTPDFVEYVCEQLAGVGAIRHRKMFGDYMVYINDKPVLLVCDNTVFVKKHDCLNEDMKGAPSGVPYPGAKSHYILDIDDAAFAQRVVRRLEAVILPSKPRGCNPKWKEEVISGTGNL
ncbi:MAG: TfoX/Sxy family protein [Candidatus Accumulibacter sp.]|jgi:TfoX/Sxy family transcriptional regulator of competence genes|nr:TfoX/Sxy family protein [Accumulibacter sp.]